ncbi:MAG: glycerol kinase GlpK [Candidatus Competibacteraceae bacterium]|nr:glycerol kinase GlpK [Candidatus Competibacteraceae bacterium]
MKYILSIDQGTTSSRALIFDMQGALIVMAQREITQYFPQPGWVEHDPVEIWESQLAVCLEAIRKAAIKPTDIQAIGITNQRETTILWDKKTGQPVGRAIVWQDRRTANDCEKWIEQGHADTIRGKTGLMLDAYFSASKIRWVLTHNEWAYQLAAQNQLAFGTVDTWLLWNLTAGAVHATDISNASRTMLFNIHTLQWDTDLLKLFGIPPSILPEVKSNACYFGQTTCLHPEISIPITGMAGDQQAALFGHRCDKKGMAKNTYGTGCFVVMNTGNSPINASQRLISTIAWKINHQVTYALEGSIFVGGAVVQWLRDELQFFHESSEVEQLAQEVTDNGNVYFVPALSGLGAPYWDPHARGMMLGLTRGTSKAHIARAALESIAFQTCDVLQAMQEDLKHPLTLLRADGGATKNNWLMQFQSDMAGIMLQIPQMKEVTALGAARFAALGAALPDFLSTDSNDSLNNTFEPNTDSIDRNRMLKKWQQAVSLCRQWHITDEL